MYGGIYRSGNKYYKPYAIVTDVGDKDLKCARIKLVDGVYHYHDREKFYMEMIRLKTFLLKKSVVMILR